MKPFYIYTNINDLAVYTGHDAIVPGYALNKESFFGSFCSLNKYGIIVTDKILSKHFIEKTCAHKNIVPVVIETILPFDDTTLVFIIDKDYRMRQDVLSNYCDSDLAVFVREYLPAVNFMRIYGFDNKIDAFVYGNAALLPQLIAKTHFRVNNMVITEIDCARLEKVLPTTADKIRMEKSLFRNKIKAAFVAAMASFVEDNDIYQGNFDKTIFELAEKRVAFDTFIADKIKDFSLSEYSLPLPDRFIFPNIEALLCSKYLADDFAYIKKQTFAKEIAVNMLLYQTAIDVSMEERNIVDGNLILFDNKAWKNKLQNRFFANLAKIILDQGIKEKHKQIFSLLDQDNNIKEILDMTKNIDYYSSFRAIYIFVQTARFRNYRDVAATINHFKIIPAEARLIWFLYGLNFGMNGLSVNFKNNYHAVYFGELLSIKHVKDKSLPREVVNTKEYFRVRGIPFPNSSEGYYLYHRSKKQERERESSFAQISLFSGGDKE